MFKKSLVLVAVVLALCFGFAACGSNTKSLEARITQLERELEEAKQASGIKGDTGEQGPQGPMGGGLVGNPTPDKVYQLGETVTYYSNGLKLFDITVVAIQREVASPNRIFVRFTFTSHNFIVSNEYLNPLGDTLCAKLVNADNTSLNHNGSIQESGGIRNFVFTTVPSGKKTLYICTVPNYLPFAIYDLTLSA